jgi:hypothetical protein
MISHICSSWWICGSCRCKLEWDNIVSIGIGILLLNVEEEEESANEWKVLVQHIPVFRAKNEVNF